jgi:phenylpropionate dioxygenase-like ring-hydroxylating dioxygenase large terminal subunit
MYLDECWYAAGWSEDLDQGLMDLTICEERILVFRREGGELAGLSGICPHRFASLSLGKRLEGDQIRCPYHGLVFDADGQCLGGPFGPAPRSIALKTFKVVERHSLVWVWRGKVEAADESLIPDFSVLQDPRYRTLRGAIRTHANFELITDNLMDLTHVGIVHDGGLGSAGILKGRHSVVQEGATVYSDLWCPDGPPAPVWKALFGDYPDNVDHWLDMRWDAPASMLLDVGVAPVGANRQGGITQWGANILTPVSETETLYLWASARDFALQDDNVDGMIRAAIDQAFAGEDKPMIEDVQRNMAGRSFREMRPVIMALDQGAIRARMVLADLQTGKRAVAPTAPRPRDSVTA